MKELVESSERHLLLIDSLKKSYETIEKVEWLECQTPEGHTNYIIWDHPQDGRITVVNDGQLQMAMRGAAAGIYSELKSEGLKEVADEVIETVLFEK